MRHYTEKLQPEKLVKTLTKTTCDICGRDAHQGYWESSSYEINETEIEVTVRHKDGNIYPEDGWGTKYEVDICPECFKTKLIPFLKSIGCTTERVDWDY